MGVKQSLQVPQALHYQLKDRLEFTSRVGWIVRNASSVTPVVRDVCIFSFEDVNVEGVTKKAAQNCCQRLKTLRHPSLLKYVDSLVTANGIFIVTERVLPLSSVLNSLSRSEILLGLHQIISALSFLHESKLSHNNLAVESIYVSTGPSGDWKLGGLDFTYPENEVSFSLLRASSALRSSSVAEDEQAYCSVPYARDAYALGNLISELLTSRPPPVGHFDTTLAVVNALCDPNPECRPAVARMLDYDMFQSDALVSTVEFVQRITVKKPDEKEAFFKSLYDKILRIDMAVVIRSLLPRILTTQLLSEPSALPFLPHILSPALSIPQPRSNCPSDGTSSDAPGILPYSDYVKHVVPFIVSNYGSRFRNIRLPFMELLHYFISAIPPPLLKTTFLNETILGLKDTSPDFVSACMSALLVIGWKFLSLDEELTASLSHRSGIKVRDSKDPLSNNSHYINIESCWIQHEGFQLVNSRIVPEFCRIAAYDEDPSVRINALHGIAGLWYLDYNLGSSRVLKALKFGLADPHKDVRIAALGALQECKESHAPWQAVNKVMPLAYPLLLDLEPDVRLQAHNTLTELLNYRRQTDLRLEPSEVIYPSRDESEFISRAVGVPYFDGAVVSRVASSSRHLLPPAMSHHHHHPPTVSSRSPEPSPLPHNNNNNNNNNDAAVVPILDLRDLAIPVDSYPSSQNSSIRSISRAEHMAALTAISLALPQKTGSLDHHHIDARLVPGSQGTHVLWGETPQDSDDEGLAL